MNEYVESLKRYVAENPPNYGSDAHSILEMLFTYYRNNTKLISGTISLHGMRKAPTVSDRRFV